MSQNQGVENRILLASLNMLQLDATVVSRTNSSTILDTASMDVEHGGPSVDHSIVMNTLQAPQQVTSRPDSLTVPGVPININLLSSSNTGGLSIDSTVLNAPVNINLSIDHPTNANTLSSQPKAVNDPPPVLHQWHCSAFLMHQEAIMSLIRLVDGVYPQDSMDLDVQESQRCLSQELDPYHECLDAIVDAQWAKLKGEQGLQSFSGSLNLMPDLSYSTG
ncbi:hypothetical protein F5J12DRAFT_786228 [Pisolithus orientalis]|uniref:uncharacterized protein n=1 Tax=Pisolithus orientalis TaxID=936130 RepID=UPI002224BF37|nr:uncharacterized protein F5J12DRAFT_786228 [Pisolithus orientalis]KAI5991994.1 hypothetical protein F5J12DRAFT_786228 [Pisolithus orientalis]